MQGTILLLTVCCSCIYYSSKWPPCIYSKCCNEQEKNYSSVDRCTTKISKTQAVKGQKKYFSGGKNQEVYNVNSNKWCQDKKKCQAIK